MALRSLLALLAWLPLLAWGERAPAPSEAWQSESFSELALKALKDQDLKSLNVRPVSEVVLDEAGFEVRRQTKGAQTALLAPFVGTLDRVKFKVVSVEMTRPRAPVTRQLVTLAGRAQRGYLEMNATWVITWQWRGEGAPTMGKVLVEAHEEVLAKEVSQPVFQEATLEVIGQTEAYQKQLHFGNTYWRQRIELFNRFFKFGHHGLAIGDANGDGLEDVYVCQNGGLPNRLFIQQADGTAKEMAAEFQVDLLDLTRSALFLDLDNDGDQDLVLAADTGLLAFRNDGKGRFEPKLRYRPVRNAFSLSAADYDNDGDLDLFVCRYYAKKEEGAGLALPAPYFDANNGGGNFLIRNDGLAGNEAQWLNFTDATAESGLDAQNNRRFSFASVWEDIDNDGDQDLFVANDFGQKNLYLNTKGKFTDIATQAGIDDGGFGMSASSGDFDNDAVPDLYAGNMFSAAGRRVTTQPQFRPGLDAKVLTKFQRMARGNSLFRGLGKGRFNDVSESAKVLVGRWSWGSVFGDLNNDGWQDLIVANGFVTGRVPDDL